MPPESRRQVTREARFQNAISDISTVNQACYGQPEKFAKNEITMLKKPNPARLAPAHACPFREYAGDGHE
jgi:hypothetical protein